MVPVSEEPLYLSIVDQDPNLALVGLRIEIEKRLRTLSQLSGEPAQSSLAQITGMLAAKGVLEPQAAIGLRDLIALGNQAAHGRTVSTDVALSAADYAPGVLRALDNKIATMRGRA
jgi:hypothetical protein